MSLASVQRVLVAAAAVALAGRVHAADISGAATSVQWPVGIGAMGNEGLANQPTHTDGAIGYVEYAYAKQNKMAHMLLINQAHHPVAPSAASFQAAAANSWPITGASFILVYRNRPDPAATGQALKVFGWAYQNGTQMAADLDYVPLPAALIAQVQST